MSYTGDRNEGALIMSSRSAVVTVPDYPLVQTDEEGNAILPSNFLPAMVDKLPDDWFIQTYNYFPYFDRNQRDRNGEVYVPPSLRTANTANVKKLKELAVCILDKSFKDEGRYHYGLEIGRMSEADGHKCEGRKNARRCETPDLAQKVLFEQVAPALIKEDKLGELVSYAWKWFHVPNLEGNNGWVKYGLQQFFTLHDARVILADEMMAKQRVHSIATLFKKYGTQSSIRTFKTNQMKNWKFVVEVNKYRKNDGLFPEAGEGENWSAHNIEGYLTDKIRRMMRRNGGFEFLIRHTDTTWDYGKLLSSDLQDAVNRAIRRDVDKAEVMNRMIAVAKSVKGGLVAACDDSPAKKVVHTPETLGLSDKYEEDLKNLRIGAADFAEDDGALGIGDIIEGLEKVDNRSWASGPATPAKGDERTPGTPGSEAAVRDGSGKKVPFSPTLPSPRRSPRNKGPHKDMTPVEKGPVTRRRGTPLEERQMSRGRGHTFKPTSARKKSNRSQSCYSPKGGEKPAQSAFQMKMAAMAKKSNTVCILYHCVFIYL